MKKAVDSGWDRRMMMIHYNRLMCGGPNGINTFSKSFWCLICTDVCGRLLFHTVDPARSKKLSECGTIVVLIYGPLSHSTGVKRSVTRVSFGQAPANSTAAAAANNPAATNNPAAANSPAAVNTSADTDTAGAAVHRPMRRLWLGAAFVAVSGVLENHLWPRWARPTG